MQVYRPLYDSLVYRMGHFYDLRPLQMFYEPVEWNGKEVERFARITDLAVIAELKRVKQEMYPND